MDSVIGEGYSRTVTKSQPYRGLGLVTWADRAADGNLDIELLGTVTTATSGRSSEFRKGANHNPAELAEDIANGTFPAIPINGLLRTPVADETGGDDFSCYGEGEGSDSQVVGLDCGLGTAWQTATAKRERERDLMPTPTTRDFKDTSVTVAKHRPMDKDTLNRALAHLFSPHPLRVKE